MDKMGDLHPLAFFGNREVAIKAKIDGRIL
jgi:hypothetical protein